MELFRWVKNNSATILTWLAAIGTVATAVLVAKETPNALMAAYHAEGEAEEGEELLAKVKAAAPMYAPAIVTGTATIACIFAANKLSLKQVAGLAAAYAALENAYIDRKEKVAELFGEQANVIVEKAVELEEEDPSELCQTQTFYEEHVGHFFEMTKADVLLAEYHLNRNFVLRGCTTLNEFLTFLKQEPVENGDSIGWDVGDGEAYYGYQWVDFRHRYFETDDGLRICAIEMMVMPHPLEEPTYNEFEFGRVID